MKISKIIAGMSAVALAAAVAVPVTADEAPADGGFYNATGTWTINFDGSSLDNVATAVDPEGDSWSEGSKGQLVGYTNQETGKVDYYNFGCNFQVGHMKKAIVTIRVTSDTNNIWLADENAAGEGTAASEGYMYTVQKSWNGDCSADFQQGWTHSYDADGKPVYADGACDMNGWNSGSGKFNGQWVQISLTDDNLSALHFEITVEATDKTTWEYHPYSEESADDYQYIISNGFGGNGGFTPSSVSGDGDPYSKVNATDEGDTVTVVVDGDYINKQIPGAACKDGDDSSEGGNGDSNGDSKGGDNSNADSNASGSDSNNSKGGNNNSKGGNGGNGGKGGSGTTGTNTSAAGEGEAASDATENAKSGAAAGVGLAIAALAGAAIVVSRKK
ncbi:MAG: hypothetical protein IIZ73_07560 [Ruminococcus sp.]|nr:hypothetical protein [Ruminococcus sp.]